MLRGLAANACNTARRICDAEALRNADHMSAIVPVTNGAAALVPVKVKVFVSVPRLVTFWPGARNPLRPTEGPRLEIRSGLPRSSQAATGITQG
jgi:hypothetical protein